jgi:hypothetical protein
MDTVPIVALGCFAGVRPDESARMKWEMSDNLIDWLFLCRKPFGKILPENFRRKRWALCQAMNWKDGWPEDILRHSYGSYHLAKYRNAALTADQMGQKMRDALCALSRGGEKLRRYH